MPLPRRLPPFARPTRALLTLALGLALAATPGPARARSVARHRADDAPLSGTVTDRAGAPLSGARVLVVELDRAVVTGGDGAFRFDDLPPGRYTIQVRRAGHAARLLPVEAPAPAPLVIELRTDPLPVEPLNVTVTRGALASLRSPLPAAIVGREALDREQSVSLAHTLERLPGVRNLSTGREIGKPVIRGLSGARVLVVSQGLRLEDYGWSDEDGPSVDAAVADRVEVVRGPATVLYGPDAVGGVVNVIPRPLPVAAAGEGTFDATGELGVKSNNREVDLVLRGEGATGPWGWRALVAGRKAEALHTPLGELENTGFGAVSGEAAVARRGAWGSLTARYVRYGGEFFLLEEDGPPPGEGGEAAVEEGGPERKLSDDRLQLLGNFPVGEGLRLETRVQGQRHHLIEMEDDPAALAEGRFVEVEIYDLVLSTGVGEVLLHHRLAPGVDGTVGLSGKLQTSTGDGVVPLVPDADMASGGAFVLERLEAGPLTLLAGARADVATVDAAGRPGRTFRAATGSLGGAFEAVDGLALTAHVGAAWRAPTLFELYAEGPRLGEARYEVGDASLVEERALDLDVGLRVERERVRGHVAAFRNAFDGFLYIQPTDEVRDGYRVFEYRQADAALWGGEASLELEATGWLSVSAMGDLTRGTNETVDEPLPLIPPRRARLGLEVHGATPWAERAFVSVEGELVAAPDRLNPFDTPVDGYRLVDLAAGAEGRWGRRPVRVDVGVRNLLDASYRDFLSRYKAFALNPGRDVVLRVRMGM